MTRAAPPRHVLITGGGGGLGAAMAIRFADAGARIGLCGRDPDKLRRAAEACRGETRATVCDVADADAMRDWLLFSDGLAPVDCVVACAGIGGDSAVARPYGEGAEIARKIVDVNLTGVLNATSPLLERMIARGEGRIAIVSSMAGLIALPDSPTYCATKAAAMVYGESLRRLLRKTGVSVTVICPGFVDTDMSRSLSMKPPFLWTAERAAKVMTEGIIRRRALVAFPWQLRLPILLSRHLPRALNDRILDLWRLEEPR